MSWIFEGKEITKITDLPKKHRDAYGYIYCLVVKDTGKEYIGSKIFFTTRSKKASNKKVKQLGKSFFRRKKNTKGKNKGEMTYYEVVKKESNWVLYNGSNKQLLEDIKNGAEVTKYILEVVNSKAMLLYKETKHILCTGALEEDKFYNAHALGRFYKKNIINK